MTVGAGIAIGLSACGMAGVLGVLAWRDPGMTATVLGIVAVLGLPIALLAVLKP